VTPGGGTLITFTGGVHGDRHTGTVSLPVVPLGIGTFPKPLVPHQLERDRRRRRRLASIRVRSS